MVLPPEIVALLGVAMGLIAIIGTAVGVLRGKFVLGSKWHSKTYPVMREQNPVLFWLVVIILAGLGGLCIWAAFRIQP